MAHHYGSGLMRQRSEIWRSLRDGDYEEEDVWDVLRESRDDFGSSSIPIPRKKPSSSPATSSRMIPTRGYSFTSDSSQSAPVDIPDWSKVVRRRSEPKKSSKKSSDPWFEDDDDDDDDDHHHHQDNDFDGAASDGEDNVNYKAPPHEIIARRMARSHVSSFSVFEGVGRTLKGRDLEKVRNAVLTRTGFLESL